MAIGSLVGGIVGGLSPCGISSRPGTIEDGCPSCGCETDGNFAYCSACAAALARPAANWRARLHKLIACGKENPA